MLTVEAHNAIFIPIKPCTSVPFYRVKILRRILFSVANEFNLKFTILHLDFKLSVSTPMIWTTLIEYTFQRQCFVPLWQNLRFHANTRTLQNRLHKQHQLLYKWTEYAKMNFGMIHRRGWSPTPGTTEDPPRSRWSCYQFNHPKHAIRTIQIRTVGSNSGDSQGDNCELIVGERGEGMT